MRESHSAISHPIFLVGAERSGTTLLRLMLDCHRDIAFYSEFEFVVDYFQGQEYPSLIDYYESLTTDRLFQSSNFQVDRSLNFPQLVNSFLRQNQQRAGKKIVGATVHRHSDRLLKIWPNAKFIHILRDGRDVARSCVRMNWAGNVWAGCDRWLEAENLWSQVKLTLPHDRYIEISYESLISQPVSSLTKICKFLGTNYDAAMLSYPEISSYDAPNPRLSQQWKHKLSKSEIRLIEAKIGHLLCEKGYEVENSLPLNINPLYEQLLKLHSKLAMVWGRINIYGLFLICSSFLSRNLKLQQWQKHIQLQCNQIDTARLK